MGYYFDIIGKINSATKDEEIKEIFDQVERQSPSIKKAADENRKSEGSKREQEEKKTPSIPQLVNLSNTFSNNRTISTPASSYLLGALPTPSVPYAAARQNDPVYSAALDLTTGKYESTDAQDFAKSFAYGTEKTLAGAAGAVEDALRFASGYGNKLLSGITSLGGLADNPVSDFLSQTAENTLSGSYVDRWRQSIDERYQPTAFQQKLGGLNEAAGAMLPSIAASFATGGLSNAAAIGKGASMTAAGAKAAQDLSRGVGLASMFPQVAGASTRQAMNEGADVDRALAYGALSGALEAGTESLFAGIPGLKSGVVSDLIQKAGRSPVVNRAADILGEGVEEVISGYVSPYLQRMTYNEQAELASSDELLESFISGVALSGIMQGGAGIAGRIASRSVGQGIDVNSLGENSRKNYISQMERDGGTTRGFDEQWKRYNDAGLAGIPFDQVPGEPTGIGMSRAYAAHAAGMNDYNARQAQQPTTVETDIPSYTAPQATETTEPTTYTPGLIQNGYTSSVSENTAKSIDSIAKKAGVTVEIADDVPAAGEYRDGVIRIHANAENPVRQVFVHELTHHLEQSDGYGELVDFYRANTEKSGVRLADLVRAKQEQYAEQGIQLTEDAAQREIIAEFCDTTLFTDERSIMRLAHEKRSLVQKIRDWMHEMRVRLRGTQQEKFILEAEKRYQKALDSLDGQKKSAPGGTQYKIESLSDGKQYVKADRPVIQGNDPKQWSRQAEQFINEKIRGGEDITVYTPDGFAVQITDRSAYKLTDTHVQRIQKIGRDKLPTEALGAKMRAAGHIDELIATANWKNWQADKNGNHANDIGEQGFDYFTTYFEDENGDYYRVVFSAGVNEGTGNYINDDTDTAYSIGDMQKRNRSANNGSSTSPTGSGALTARTVSNTSISPSAQNGNPSGQNNSGKPNQFKVDGSNYYDLLRKAGYIEQADALQRASGQYGTINRGEMPARDVQLPAQMDENTRVRRFARTAAESSILTDEQAGEIGKAVAEGRFNYEPITNKAARAHAESVLSRGEQYAQDAWDRVVNRNRVASKNDIAVGEYLLKQAAETGDTQRVVELTAQIAAEGTRAGQIVQAMSMLKRLDGVGQSIALDAMLKKLQGELDRGKSGVFLKVPDNLRENLIKAKGKEQVDSAMDEILENLAQQMPKRWSDKWNAWRYLAMLGNPRTHIRNVLGNAFFAPVVGTKNIVGAVIESGVYNAQRLAGKQGIERTKTIRGAIPLSGGKARAFAVDDFSKVEDIIKGGGKMNPSDIIREKQRVFKFKPLEWLRKLNFNLLEAEDGKFLKYHYTRSMVQYLQANKIDLDTFNPDGSQRDAAALQRARDYAIKEAQKATYRDFSRAAQVISNASRNAGGAVNILIEGVLPFKKTPINVLKRGIEYSPAGLLQSITIGTNQLRKGDISANEFIDRLSAGLTGTGISLLGMLLFRSGLLVGGSGDDKEAEFRDSLGAQSYAIRLEDKTYTIDWLAPACMPLFVGAEIQNLADTFDGVDGRVIYDAVLDLAEPMTKMSMLDGLNSAISSVRYGEDQLSDLATNAVIGYIGQAVPTLFGQIARTLDDTARTTYIEKNGSLPDSVQRALQKNRNKIPGLSNQSIAYRDVFGRAEKDTSMISRALKNFISPGYFSEEKIGSMESELIRVYQNTDDSGVLPSMPAKYFNVNGERKDLTAEEYEKFSYTRGSIMYSNLSELTETSLYKNLDDTDKASAISNVIELSNALAKTEVSDYQLEGWMADAKGAFDKGIKIPDFILIRDGASQIDSFKDEEGKTVTNSPSVRKAYYLLTETNLTPSQRCYMYEVLNVGKKVQEMSPDKVKAEYQKMYNRYGR